MFGSINYPCSNLSQQPPVVKLCPGEDMMNYDHPDKTRISRAVRLKPIY